jgi:hypothetical protein
MTFGHQEDRAERTVYLPESLSQDLEQIANEIYDGNVSRTIRQSVRTLITAAESMGYKTMRVNVRAYRLNKYVEESLDDQDEIYCPLCGNLQPVPESYTLTDERLEIAISRGLINTVNPEFDRDEIIGDAICPSCYGVIETALKRILKVHQVADSKTGNRYPHAGKIQKELRPDPPSPAERGWKLERTKIGTYRRRYINVNTEE